MTTSNSNIRVRFAPSPTGYLHIGGARTALFNWFFAKKNNGKMVLRIEDTDTERLKEDSVRQILSSMKWLGITWDEGPDTAGSYAPYFQSERLDIYRKEAERLLKEDKAYYCFCTSEDIEKEREEQKKSGDNFKYSKKCSHLTKEEIEKRLADGAKPVIRIKSPDSGSTEVDDLIRSHVTFNNEQMDDFIIMKSNGIATYNFACVVDDHAMEINYIIRAEEHLSNTPKQVHIYNVLGYQLPNFAHISMILAPDRSKLSKRHGATSVEEFRDLGFLPEALVNYLTLLGWSPGSDDEIFSVDFTAQNFSFDRVSKTAAVYDVQKLAWMNGQYMMAADLDYLTDLAIPFIHAANPGIVENDFAYCKEVVNMMKARARTLKELADTSTYFFADVTKYEDKGIRKSFQKEGCTDLIRKIIDCLDSLDDFESETIDKAYHELAEKHEIKTAEFIHPTRLAVSGVTGGPGLFELMHLLGKKKCLDRLHQAIDYINNL